MSGRGDEFTIEVLSMIPRNFNSNMTSIREKWHRLKYYINKVEIWKGVYNEWKAYEVARSLCCSL